MGERQQLPLLLSRNAVEQAIADGHLSIVVDPERRLGNYGFVGDRNYGPEIPIRVVHVMSRPAGGEIRGYVLVDGELRLRIPCYTGHWPEMDAAVSRHIGASVAPYECSAGGAVRGDTR